MVRHLLRCDRGTQSERRRGCQPRVPALLLCLDHYESVGGCAVALSGSPGLVRSGSQLDPRLLRNAGAEQKAAGALAARLPGLLTGVGGVDAHAVFRMRRQSESAQGCAW